MKLNRFPRILSFCALFISSVSTAGLINQSDGVLNWNYDESTDLQWLDLTHTTGLSYNQITSQYTGWQLATESQWQSMYSLYFDGSLNDGSLQSETSNYLVDNALGFESVSSGGTELYNEFIAYENFFGQTSYSYERSGGMFDLNRYRESFYSFGLYVNNVDPGYDFTSRLRLGGVSIFIDQNLSSYSTTVESHFDATENLGRHWVMLNPNLAPVHGWYLVREAPNAVMINEPTSIALIFIGVGILLFQRRRAKPSRL